MMEKLQTENLGESQIQEIKEYVKDNRVQELFNEILTNILYDKPEDVKGYIVNCLKNVNRVKADDANCQRVHTLP